MAKCSHPMTERQWNEGKLICNLCQTVLRQNSPDPVATEDLFSGDAPAQPEIQEEVQEEVQEETPEDESLPEASPFDDLPGGEEVDPTSIPAAPETVSASEEGLTIGNVSQPFQRPVNVQVTPIQLGSMSLEQATLYRELKDTEDAKKASAKAYGDRITRIEVRLDEISKIITEGVIETPIDCQWEFLFGQGIKRLIRLDTHEVVDEKTLTTEEYQMDLNYQAGESIAAVEECFKTEEAGSEEIPASETKELLPGQCHECLFKSGNHSPACSMRGEDVYSLCQCGVCGAEAACVPYDKCKCGEGVMDPADIGEYQNVEGEDQE